MTRERTPRPRPRDLPGDRGSVTPFIAILASALIAVAGLVLDAGLALTAKVRATTIAQAAARTGATQLDLATYRASGEAVIDPGRAETAALDWVRRAGYTGTATATRTHVTVHITHTHPTQILSVAGVTGIDITATATARPEENPP